MKKILKIIAVATYLSISLVFSIHSGLQMATSTEHVGLTLDRYGNGTPCGLDPNCTIVTTVNVAAAVGLGAGFLIFCLIVGLIILFVLHLIAGTLREAEAEEAIRELNYPSLKVEDIGNGVSIATKGNKRYLIKDGKASLLDD